MIVNQESSDIDNWLREYHDIYHHHANTLITLVFGVIEHEGEHVEETSKTRRAGNIRDANTPSKSRGPTFYLANKRQTRCQAFRGGGRDDLTEPAESCVSKERKTGDVEAILPPELITMSPCFLHCLQRELRKQEKTYMPDYHHQE